MRVKGYNKEIIKLIKYRLDKGKSEYGGEINIHDGRDWTREALEEALDLAVYISANLLQLKIDNTNDFKFMYLSELEDKLKHERRVERREMKIRKLKKQLTESDQLLRKAQRFVMQDEIQEYFESRVSE
jgi:phage terminase large subunit GpA-like protein